MAGQNLPKRMNMGGGEVLVTYWLNSESWALGGGLSRRGGNDAGVCWRMPFTTTSTGHWCYMNMGMLGAQYRGPKNQYAAFNYHAYCGVSHGIFDAQH